MKDWEIIDRTADLLEQRGHCTGQLINKKSEVCVDGALALALGFDSHELEADPEGFYEYDEMNRIASRIVSALNLDQDVLHHAPDAAFTVVLFRWNDRDVNSGLLTQEQNTQKILDGLRKAAKVVRQQDQI